MATILQNANRIKAAADDIREVIDLCYEEVGDDERIEDYAPKLARLAVDDATEQVIATAARTTAGGVAIKDSIAVVDKVYGNTLVWNQLFDVPILKGAIKCPFVSYNQNTYPITFDRESGVVSLYHKAGANSELRTYYKYDITKDHKYLFAARFKYEGDRGKWGFIAYAPTNTSDAIKAKYEEYEGVNYGWFTQILTASLDAVNANLRLAHCPTDNFAVTSYVTNFFVFDITRMFGSGQEPSTLDDFCLKIFGKESASVTDAEWEAVSAYCEPTLLSSKPKKVVSKERTLWLNQLFKNSDFSSSTTWGKNSTTSMNIHDGVCYIEVVSPQANQVTQKINTYKSHKYFVTIDVFGDTSTDAVFALYNNVNYKMFYSDTFNVSSEKTKFCRFITPSYDCNTAIFYMSKSSGMQVGNSMTLDNFAIIDLTAMFGSGNEPTTINEFTQRIFGKDSDAVTDEEWASISAYNEGEELNYKLGTPFVSEIEIDPTAIVDEEGEQVFPNGLLSAGSAKDYIDLERGVAVKCVYEFDLSKLTSFSYDSTRKRFRSSQLPFEIKTFNGERANKFATCTLYECNETSANATNYKDKSIQGGGKAIYIHDERFETQEDLKAALIGVYVNLSFETPIEYPLPKRKCFYRVSNGGKEYITSDGIIPMVADIGYREAVTASEAVAMMAESAGI